MTAKETRAVDPVLEAVRKQTAQNAAEDSAARQALGNPLPGPLAKALAINQGIYVANWRVRPLCDGDFEVLVELDHPIRKIMEMQFDMAYRGKEADKDGPGFDSYTPRGPSMWQLAWMLTRPAHDVRKTVKSGGVEALKEAAEEEFYIVPAPVLVNIYLAVAEQISRYWSTTLSYGQAPKDGEDAAAVAPSNPSM